MCVCVCVCVSQPIVIEVSVFGNDPGDWGSVPGEVIPKTQKMVLDAYLLNTQNYKVRFKGKWVNQRKGLVHSLTSRCSSY